ncbi:uncharacterized protein ADD1 isoform X2 [Calliphora vicina]|uniref:uncharacterized protein ADD1 isoform X2 n=1 Tax=Calliphora vicina TaxID=7373 RepID=UPI00325BE713
MESTGGSSGSTMTAAAAMPSPSVVADSSRATNYEFDPSIKEEERRFYLKAYPTVDVVRERKTHCTVCKVHIGTAPVQEHGIKMHPILRVTHCNKCHDFYNSGEFSKGEDGSELYCRWCGQGGEVYCCSSCPYVFCKSCIVKNLSRGVVADIEQNENWNCFSCAPKILWPLRAQHWALMNYIEQQKKEIYALNLSEAELKVNLSKDRSRCCRLAKSKCGNMSDSMESLDSLASKRSHGSATKKPIKHSATPSPQQINAAKRAKTNDEVVCTPDLLSMLEPDCQITVSPKPNRPMTTPSASTPKIMSIQQPQAGYGSMSSTPKSSAPPPLVLRNTAIKLRPAAPPPVVRRTIIGPRTPNPGGNGTPVYHTINGYRIDLNSAAQQETFRLPNGKLIQVKRQGPPTPQNASPSANNWQRMSSPQPQRVIPQTIASRPVQITQHPYNISVQHHPQVLRYNSSMIGSTTINPVNHNGTTIQVLNGQMTSQSQPQQQQQQQVQQSGPVRPVMVRHVFPDNPIGQARNGLQDQVFNAMEICTHLTNKVQTLTNSNAYKQARNFLEVKELYIHLSYLLTYAIGRFKSLQDKCLGDMRTLGFGNDADCLENGQLAADKQASDDEDNEIEIVEPKTDLITLDSDDDEPPASTPIKTQHPIAQIKTQLKAYSSPQHSVDVKIKPRLSPASIAQAYKPVVAKSSGSLHNTSQADDDNMDLMSMAQSFLASMLEVDIHEGPLNSPGSDSSAQKKQPRKKLTNKPNPTLLKQKALMELERLEEMKRNDQKLKMKCAVELKKAEEVYPYAKEMLEAKAKERQEYEEAKNNKLKQQQDKKLTDETENVTAEVIMDDDAMNSSTEETNKTETKDTIKTNTTTIEKKEATEASVEITEKNNDKTEDEEENIAEKETSMETSEKETCEEIQDKSTENIADNEIPTETTEKETSVEIQQEIKDKSEENIAENDISTEKETSVEIIDNIEDTTTEDILQKDEEEPQDLEDKKAEVKSNDHADDDKKENKNTIATGAISKTIENSKNDDTEKNKANGVTNEDKIQEDMEIDEQPPGTPTQDESMDNDEDEKAQASAETSLTTDDMETNNTKPDEKLDIDQDKEKVLPPQENNDNDKNIDKENENVVPQKEANEEDENMNESVEAGNENQLSSPTKETLTSPKKCEVEEPSTKPTTTTSTEIESDKDKDTVKDLANTEETIKTSPSAAEDIPSKKQTIETPATEIEATTTSSNGNI